MGTKAWLLASHRASSPPFSIPRSSHYWWEALLPLPRLPESSRLEKLPLLVSVLPHWTQIPLSSTLGHPSYFYKSLSLKRMPLTQLRALPWPFQWDLSKEPQPRFPSGPGRRIWPLLTSGRMDLPHPPPSPFPPVPPSSAPLNEACPCPHTSPGLPRRPPARPPTPPGRLPDSPTSGSQPARPPPQRPH